jgi:hypothetical protein
VTRAGPPGSGCAPERVREQPASMRGCHSPEQLAGGREKV